MRGRVGFLVLALLAPACASPLADAPAAPQGGPPRDLAVEATVIPESSPGPSPNEPRKKKLKDETDATQGAAGERSGSKKDDRSKAGKGQDHAEVPAGFRILGSTSDGAGDAGLSVPGYADFVLVSVEGDHENARVTIGMAGPIPAQLPEGEVEGVGVDLYRGANDSKDDYQVFATGNADGWLGYLYAEDGFVKFKGTLEVSNTALVFTVPWSSIGGEEGGTFSAFADWSGPGTIAVNPTGQDLAPDRGEQRFG